MVGYFLKRILQSIVVILVVSVVVFVILYHAGDPVRLLLPPDATQQQMEELRHHLGLDQPFAVQYWRFFHNALRGDLGTSFAFNQPAIGLILERVPATLELAVTAMALSVLMGIPAGMYAAIRPQSWGAISSWRRG
jgi:peptide/nickel transport system permease protein